MKHAQDVPPYGLVLLVVVGVGQQEQSQRDYAGAVLVLMSCQQLNLQQHYAEQSKWVTCCPVEAELVLNLLLSQQDCAKEVGA